MADDTSEDAGPASDTGRAKRVPPTIDLEATEVSTAPQPATSDAEAEPQPALEPRPEPEPQPEPEPAKPEAEPEHAQAAAPISPPVSPWVIAPFSGAVAAALVMGVGWMLGWPAVQPATPPAPQVSAATVEALAGRLASLESRASRPAAPVTDPAAAARIDALEKAAAALRGDVTGLRAQSEQFAGRLNEAKSEPGAGPAAADLSALSDRVAQLERASRTERAEIAQQSEKMAETKPPDDTPLRRVVAASLLDVAVRHGDAYPSLLTTAKSFAPDAQALAPLEVFASSGVPSPPALARELLNVVPKLSPPAESRSSGTGIVDRLQAGAAKLVRVERTDGVGNDRDAIVARITAAALRNDVVEARRELMTLAPAERAPAQAWLDKADARDAALAAARKFADEAMADLAKPAP